MTTPGEPQPAPTGGNPAPGVSAPAPVAPEGYAHAHARVGWIPALLAAALAGLLAWAGGEWVERANTVRLVNEFVVPGSQQLAERAAAITTRATLTYGLLGAAVGLALGLAGGLARRSVVGSITGAAAGLVLGALSGGGTARLVVPFFLRNEDTTVSDALLLPLMTHGAIWSALGMAGGLALGVGRRASASQMVRTTLGGLLGAVIATAVYELAGGLAFPFDQTGQPIPAGIGSRLFAHLVVAVAVAAGAILPTRRSV